jgi:hypothetical protein
MNKFIKLSEDEFHDIYDFPEFWIVNGTPIDVGNFPNTHYGYVVKTILDKHNINPNDASIYEGTVDSGFLQQLKDAGLSDEEIRVVQETESPSEYAVKNWGWTRISGDWLHMPNISSSILMQAAQSMLSLFGERAKGSKWRIVTPAKSFHDIDFDTIASGDVKGVASNNAYASRYLAKIANSCDKIGRYANADQIDGILENKEYPEINNEVDGRSIMDGPIPNTDSISASLGDDYEVLSGIRELPLSDFDSSPNDLFYSSNDFKHTKLLAERIRETNQIKPLIVVIDKEGPYILEGAHRLGALHLLGAKTFPAMVVIDHNEEVE